MRTLLLILLTLGLVGAQNRLRADAITWTLDPPSGVISGTPGETIGWGFTITNNSTDWISMTSSDLEFVSTPKIGTYVDFIGVAGGNDNFAIAPGTSWTETFDVTAETGVGAFTLGDTWRAPSESGQLTVYYDVLSGGGVGQSLIAPITVDVVATPEPHALALLLTGLGGIAALRRR